MPMMQHSTTTMSSSTSVAAKSRGVISSLQGPRPLPLSLPGTTSSSPSRPAKRPRIVVKDVEDDDVRARRTGPVILYEHTPKVIHARPDEFKALVQRLTGRQQQQTGTVGSGDHDQEEVVLSSTQQEEQDPLVLTLGQQHVQPPLPLVDDHHHTLPMMLQPSPGGAAGGFLLSPSSFLFSPATMQAIQELIS